MSTDSSPGERRFLLEDRDWLQSRYELEGDGAIAAYVGVSRATVSRARVRLGIAARPRGGSARGVRGVGNGSSTTYSVGTYTRWRPRAARPPAASQIASRIAEESRPGGPPPSLGLLAARVRAVHEANAAGNQLALHDALVALGSGAGLVLDHLQAVESA